MTYFTVSNYSIFVDAYKYSYNKIIIGDSNGCVYVYQMEQNLLNSVTRSNIYKIKSTTQFVYIPLYDVIWCIILISDEGRN